MVFAFVLILFGFYWIDKIRERAQTSRTQSRGLRCAPASSCCQFDIPIAIYVRTLYMCAWVWEEGEGVACQGKSLWFFGDPATCLPIPLSLTPTTVRSMFKHLQYAGGANRVWVFGWINAESEVMCVGVCVRVYLAPQMRFLCVGWRLAACGCRLMEFRSGIKCDTQKLPIGIHIYSYCQSYAHTHRDTATVTVTHSQWQLQSQWNRTLCRPPSLSVSCGLACLSVKLTF